MRIKQSARKFPYREMQQSKRHVSKMKVYNLKAKEREIACQIKKGKLILALSVWELTQRLRSSGDIWIVRINTKNVWMRIKQSARSFHKGKCGKARGTNQKQKCDNFNAKEGKLQSKVG